MSRVDEYLDRIFFNLLDNDRQSTFGNSKVPLRFFDGAEVLAGNLPGWDDFVKETGLDGSVGDVLSGARPRDLSEPLDYRAVIDETDRGGYLLSRWREVSPDRARGRLTSCPPRIVEQTIAVPTGASYDIVRVWWGGSPESLDRWHQIGPNSAQQLRRGPRLIGPGTHRALSCVYGAQFSNTMKWRVSLGYDELPSFSFPTDPSGACEVFRLRDVPPGKARRAALLHWVKGHWRRKRDTSPAEFAKVREHLRGAREFVWNGMRCSIRPSADDETRLKMA